MRRIFMIAVGLLALGVGGAMAQATHFGARLTVHTEPSNAGKGDFCNVAHNHPECSFVLMQAFQCEFGSCKNGHLAPKDGTITSVSLIACFPGSFTLQIANANASTNEAQVVHSGPVIDFKGDPKHCTGNTYQIETFPVSVDVLQGQYLAVDAEDVGFVTCSGGGANMLLFDPPLADGVKARKAQGTDGCFMLLEAFYSD